jgi:hypothetical protein
MIYDMKVVYVLLGKKPVALFILLGFNNIKLLLPETNKRGIHIKHPRNFTNTVEQLFYLGFFIGHGRWNNFYLK